MAMEQQVKNGSVGSPTMLGLDVFANVDMERLRGWLRSMLLPVLRRPEFFEAMGFPSSFVQRFHNKHAHVLHFNGTIGQGVRGVNMLESLRGVAEALGVRPFQDQWDPRDIATTTAVAQQCRHALAMMGDRRGPNGLAVHQPHTVAETAEAEEGVQS